MEISLKAQIREGKSGKVLEEEKIPAILYGRGIENIKLHINVKEFSKLYEKAGESTILKLTLENGESRNVIIKDVQRNILTGQFTHADFYQVRMDEEIEAEIELVFIGESLAVKALGGVLVKNMDSIEIRCLPGDLPPKIEVDLAKLKTFDDYIYLKDLPISEKVEVTIDPETVIALVTPPRTEEELAELETEIKEDVSKVEGVVKEEKPEEGKEGEASAPEEKKEKKEKKE